MDAFVGQFDLAANGFQCWTGIIRHGFFIYNASTDFVVQIRQWFNLCKKSLQRILIFIIGFTASVGFRTQCHIQSGSDIQQFSHTDGTANLQTEQGAADITDAGEGETALFHDTGQGVTGLHLSLKNLRNIRGRHQITAQLLAHRGAGIAGKHIYNFRVFENTQCFFIHK